MADRHQVVNKQSHNARVGFGHPVRACARGSLQRQPGTAAVRPCPGKIASAAAPTCSPLALGAGRQT